jgi:hypothetical protein
MILQSPEWKPRSMLVPLLQVVLLLTYTGKHSAQASYLSPSMSNVHDSRPALLVMNEVKIPNPLLSLFQRRSSNNNNNISYNEVETIRETSFRVIVKPRAQVSINTATGTVTENRPAPTTETTTVRQSKWNMLKKGIYGTLDKVTSLKDEISSTKDRKNKKSFLKEGYGETIEAKMQLDTQETPAQRLIQQYQQRAPDTTLRPLPKGISLFDTLKEGIYSTMDGVPTTISTTEQPLPTSPVTGFKPISKPSIATSTTIKEALPGLSSDNPLKRLLAKRTMDSWEAQQRSQEAARKRQSKVRTFKYGLYGFLDALKTSATEIITIPSKVVQVADATKMTAIASYEWAATIPGALEESVTTVSTIPTQLEYTVKETQKAVEQTIQATQQFMEDAQAIPASVQKSMKEVQSTIDNTITNVKVLVGVEERKPVPPKLPPPPLAPPVTDVIWKVAGTFAGASTKTVWVLGTSLLTLGWNVAQVAISSASTAVALRPTQTLITTPPVAMELKDVSIALDKEITAALQMAEAALNASSKALDSEVSEALRLADAALQMANDGRTYSNSGIDTSLRLAKEAALRATRDAILIERKLLRE